MQHIEIKDLSSSYGETKVLEGISLGLDKGQIVSLIGPSGSGKSTLLRVLVGLHGADSGQIYLHGNPIDYRRKSELKALRERFAIVFQQYNLFQNMNALRNVTIAPIKVQRRDPKEAEEEGKELLAKVGLGDKFKAYPDELSGGQQQRVAIARALALRPEVLLLDEVTSALDPELINEVLDAIRVLAREGMTMLVVSHEMAFVREVSSKVAFMADGRTVEIGSPEAVFDNPQTQRARDFMAKILRH